MNEDNVKGNGWQHLLFTELRGEEHLEAVLECRVVLPCPGQTEVHLHPSSKVGHCCITLMIATGMGASSHPKPSVHKIDVGGELLSFHFPFKCHLDFFFLSLTLFHINCIQLQGVSENITSA